jgi:hypothetical protein
MLHGLGWLVLLFAAIPVLLHYLLEKWDPIARRRMSLCSVGTGTVILFYVLTTNAAALGLGFVLVFLGYVVAWLGVVRESV